MSEISVWDRDGAHGVNLLRSMQKSYEERAAVCARESERRGLLRTAADLKKAADEAEGK